MRQSDVFALGFRDGAKDRHPISARQAGRRYPTFTSEEIAVYLNGHDDGRGGDTFRLDLGRQFDRERRQERRFAQAAMGF